MSNHEHLSSPSYRVLHEYEAMKGTSRQGYLQAPYDHLVGLFGEPLQGDHDKTDAHWIIETNQGIGTIYNYKDGHAYLGDTGRDVQDITFWHVGGTDEAAAQSVIDIVTSNY